MSDYSNNQQLHFSQAQNIFFIEHPSSSWIIYHKPFRIYQRAEKIKPDSKGQDQPSFSLNYIYFIKMISLITLFLIIIPMNLVSTLLFWLLALLSTQARVIEITSANIQLVLRSTGALTLLLHNPTCEHSRTYADKFIQIKTQKHLGIADCTKDKPVCQYLNITYYPTLIQLTKDKVEVIDQVQFLIQHHALEVDDPRIAQRQIIQLLGDQQRWVAIVLEEDRLPTIDRIPDSLSKRVVYVPNPSSLHAALSEMVGKQLGCWIFKKVQSQLHKYYCGNGYRSEQLERQLSNFQNGKLQRHIFSRQSNNSYIQHSQLQQIVLDIGRRQTKCRLVYFHTKACEHCYIADVQKVKDVLKKAHKERDYDLQIFDLDHQSLPKGLKLPRVPELIEFCSGKANYFGDIFTVNKLRLFLGKEGRFNSQNPSEKTDEFSPQGSSQL